VLLGTLLALRLRSRRALFAGVLALLLAGATAGGLEAAGRLGIVDWAASFRLRHVAPLGSVRLPHVTITGEADEDTAALWRIARPKTPFVYRTDRFGLRNLHDRGEAAIYCLGDSFLVAGLLPIEHTVAARLERRLGVPVMNAALVGLGPQEVRALWQELRLPARGRAVLQFVTEDNDLVDSARFRRGRRSEDIASPTARSFVASAIVWLQRVTQPVPGEARRRTGRIGGRDIAFPWHANAFAGLESEVDEVLASIASLHEEVAAARGCHGVVLVPSKLRVLGPLCTWPRDSELRDVAAALGPLPEALRAWCAAHAVPFLDLTEALRASAGRALPYFDYDTHWTAAGHAVAARELAAWPFLRHMAAALPPATR
jgi:hypothetical protein